jgi:ATP-dependent helicase HrpA
MIVGQIVEAWQLYSQRVASATSPTFRAVVADEQDHAPRLIKPGFLRSTPREWLVHVPRYLTASRLRLERLPGGGVVRDEKLLAELKPWWQLFSGNEQVLLEDGARREEFVTFRWMLEELRVSLFAQDLKTAVPISYKRLSEQWDRVVKAR